MRAAALLSIAACGGAPTPTPTPPPPPPAHAKALLGPLSAAADAKMVVIEAGRYTAGSTPAEREIAYDDYLRTSGHDYARQQHWFDHEQDLHVEDIPGFRLDVTPVTQAQYGEYVVAMHVEPPAISMGQWAAQHLQQSYDRASSYVWLDDTVDPLRADHPVVLVSYAEATAYCAWRGRRLPTAAEYEKATRGPDPAAYPWGDDFDASKLHSAVGGATGTASVTSHPSGASRYGVLDLAGNVFEWTSTPWRGGGGKITVKGSSWDDFAGVGRGASSHGRPPQMKHSIIGFRCAGDA